jgi:type IV secretory pathway VirB2 component (pilin)
MVDCMKQRGEATGGGIGILGFLGVVFVTLKLAEVGPVKEWSWWLVTLPFWGGLAFALAVVGLIFVGVCINAMVKR